jgi:hypothetical protein
VEPTEHEEKEKREGEALTGRSHMVVAVRRNLEAFVWVLLLELEKKLGQQKWRWASKSKIEALI